MKFAQRTLLILLMLSLSPGTVYADQLDGFAVFGLLFIVLHGLMSLVFLGVVAELCGTGKTGSFFKFLFGLAAAVWCTIALKDFLSEWPEEIVDQSAVNYYVDFTHTRHYAFFYFTGMALNAASVILGIRMVFVALRDIFKPKVQSPPMPFPPESSSDRP